MGFLVDLIPWLGKKFGIAALEKFSLSDDVTKFICLGALALVVVLFILHVVGKGVGKKEGNAKYAASVSKYLQDNGEVNEGNLAPFTDTCFGEKAPAAYKEGWEDAMSTAESIINNSFLSQENEDGTEEENHEPD